MGEEERLETLKELKQSRIEVNNILERLPIGKRSMALEKRKQEYEQ